MLPRGTFERRKMKQTINDKIKAIKYKKPGALAYKCVMFLARCLYYKKCKVTVNNTVDFAKYKGQPLIIVSNHASRMDYAFVTFAMNKSKRRINFVAAENEFHRSKFKLVFGLGKVIPKKNFVPDLKTIKSMAQILKREKEGTVCIFPCGMSTASGAQQTSMLGSGKMLKHFGVPVLGVRIHGGYFVSPKFDITERAGKVEIDIFELFTPEELKTMDEHTVDLKMDEAIYTDDYEWNKTRQHSYKCKGEFAGNLHQLLYKCPVCGEEMQMEGKGNTIKCLKCGNGATLDDKYNLVPLPGSKVPENIRHWFDNERRDMRRKVMQPDFHLEEHAQLGVMREYEYMTKGKTCDVVGDGIISLDKNGFKYVGTRNGEPWEVTIKSDVINTLCLPLDASFFYTYASGEFLQFIPDTASCMRWSFAVEEMYRTLGGKWQNYPWFDYEHDAPLVEEK